MMPGPHKHKGVSREPASVVTAYEVVNLSKI